MKDGLHSKRFGGAEKERKTEERDFPFFALTTFFTWVKH